MDLVLGGVRVRADISAGPEPRSLAVDIACFKDEMFVAGEEGPTSIDLPAPVVESMSVADFPAYGFAYAWGLYASTVERLTASPRCTVGARGVVLADGVECQVFVALVLGEDLAERRAASLRLWEAGAVVQELPLRT
ncbi:hypothetical protein [Isoptericola sp. NPDC057191]|uniref:hypothetical protein n=1 Tax=Isoptericola sp. NPDC057191 TaxID=3346041 RepID=UPI003642A28E